jgi:hypothetical protein
MKVRPGRELEPERDTLEHAATDTPLQGSSRQLSKLGA